MNRPHCTPGHSQGRTQAHTRAHTASTPTHGPREPVCQLSEVRGDHISHPQARATEKPGLIPGRGMGLAPYPQPSGWGALEELLTPPSCPARDRREG